MKCVKNANFFLSVKMCALQMFSNRDWESTSLVFISNSNFYISPPHSDVNVLIISSIFCVGAAITEMFSFSCREKEVSDHGPLA